MDAGHDRSHATRNERVLKITLVLTSMFLFAELINDILTKSLALISDTAHMSTDAAALVIAPATVQIGKRPADKQRTFGYYRFEILAAAFNALLLLGVALYILYETYQRLRTPAEVQPLGMLGIATIGPVVNIVSVRVLVGGREQSLNVKGVYPEVWSDLLGSIGVIFVAIVIQFTGRTWVDSAIAVLIRPWALPRIWILFGFSTNILLESMSEDIDLLFVKQALLTIPDIYSMHDLYVWSLTSGKTSLTAHLINEPAVNSEHGILSAARDRLTECFDIAHITIQFELRPHAQADTVMHFRPSGPIATATSGQSDERHGH